MKKTLRVGCIQMCTKSDPDDNLARIESFVKAASKERVDLLLSPEVALHIPRKGYPWVFLQDEHPGLKAVQKMVREASLWFVLGSLVVLLPDKRYANRTIVLGPDGSIKAFYDKIHLFDVVTVAGDIYEESKRYDAGDDIVIVKTPWGRLGLGLCYDLQFPHMFQEMQRHDTYFLSLPSCYPEANGRLYVPTLLRSRAIETLSYVFAPAQSGTHDSGRRVSGNSMIISPWGQVLASALRDEEVLIMANIDVAELEQARKMMPMHKHKRENLGSVFLIDVTIVYDQMKEAFIS